MEETNVSKHALKFCFCLFLRSSTLKNDTENEINKIENEHVI